MVALLGDEYEVVGGQVRQANKDFTDLEVILVGGSQQMASAIQTMVAGGLANWDTFGKAAGYIRNEEMAQIGDALIAVWDGKSKGTRNMISIAKRHGIKVHVFTVKEENSIEELPLFDGSEKKE